jgi:RNA polymerase sigma-70 factor (ECF subfamily)
MARADVQDRIDEAAFAALLQQHRARVLAFLQRLCGRDAEDVLQETLVKVWRLRASFDAGRNGEAWLLQAAFRTFCDHRARLRREAPAGADAALLPAPSAACALELRDEVRRCLAELPEVERALLLGFHAHGLSLRELAARHALPLNTVKSHLHRARQRLARAKENR